MTLHTFSGAVEVLNRASFERPDPETPEAEMLDDQRRRAHQQARYQGLALQAAFEQVTLRELERLPWKMTAAGIRAVSGTAPC